MMNWETTIGEHDLYWKSIPENWTEAPFLGNGCMGVLLYHNRERHALHLELGRNDICDTRDCIGSGNDICFQRPRLQIGSMEIQYSGELLDFQMQLDLYRARLLGEYTTDEGNIKFEILVHTNEMLVIAYFWGTNVRKNAVWQFVPAKAISPRQQYGIKMNQEFRVKKDYEEYPEATVNQTADEGYSIQKLANGYENVVVWHARKEEEKYCLLVHVVQGKEDAYKNAREYLARFTAPEKLLEEHDRWWADYYQRSYLSIPDKTLEDFYWMQIYKLACAARNREGAVVIDNQGPWLCGSTPWPAAWWNLNVQLSYLPCYASNHADLSLSLSRRLKENFGQLIANVPEEYQYDSAGIGCVSDLNLYSPVRKPGKEDDFREGFRELGNLTWIMHNCWQYYQVTMDQEYLKELVYPLLRRCMNYYLHFLEKKEDGKYHLPETSSPEYGIDCCDCNYELALIRFGAGTLLEIVEILGISDEKEAVWRDLLENLTPYSVDENGFMIGAGLPYTYSHRHASHLMMIYPLYDPDLRDGASDELMKRSIEYWWSKPEHLAGFSCTIGSLLWSSMKDGNRALYYLKRLWEGWLLPNTLYMEEGPVIETPLSGAQSIIEMLFQSHNGCIYLFPAMPDEWNDASFEQFLAKGGFEVSAWQKDGMLSKVRIVSRAGSPCIVESKDWDFMRLDDPRIRRISQERIEIKLIKEEAISICRRGIWMQ